MRFHQTFRRTITVLLVGTVGLLSPLHTAAQLANLSDVPLAQAPTSSVLPNLMYILDDSGSMNYNYMPDQVQTTSGGQTYRNCKLCGTPNTLESTGASSLTVNSVSSSTERITSSANHGGVVNSTVFFTSGTPPAPLVLNTTYFMSSVPSGTTFTVSATSGGATINLTNTTTGGRFIVDREQITLTNNHGGAVGSPVVFTSGTAPTPFVVGTTYFIVRVVDSDSFILSATAGGPAILPTTNPAGATVDVNGGACGGPSGFNAGSGVPCGNDNADANAPSTTSSPDYAEAPFYASVFNRIWYNPDITYSPAVSSTGVPMAANTPTSASNDRFIGGPTKNLVTNFEEVVYCNLTAPTAADLANTAKCRYQGRHNVGPFLGGQPGYFLYWKNTSPNEGLPNTVFFNKVRVTNSNPHYYNVTPNEFCSDVNLVNCALATAGGISPGTPNTLPAALRWCKTSADAVLPGVVTGTTAGTPRCRKKFDRATGYVFPRYGRMARVDITAATGSYPKGPNSVRTDCAAASCTYAEELQNFANWYGYYSNRLALMKTSTGRAFLTIDDRYRVGFITINPNTPVAASKFVPAGQFNAAQRSAWYTRLYAQTTNGSTPLREALSRVGRYYGGVTSGINAGMGADPVQFSCQTNYALLTTDGYWNQAAQVGQNLAGGAVGNQDNSDTGLTTRGVGAFDGNLAGATDTLADVAAYYYKTDLRTAGPTAPNNVPTSQKDTAAHQHMVTFGLGLGLEGLMDYDSTYESPSNTTSDFAKIKQAQTGTCSWTAGTCDWPVPVLNDPSTLDDLWHAAVNGRGAYFSASDPNSLAQGLQSALAKLKVQTAAAAASATSSPNITQTDNFIYSSTFRTGVWDGEIVAQRIDIATGNILPAIVWSAQALLDGRTGTNADSRTLYTIDDGAGNKRKNFKYANLSSVPTGSILAERPYFTNKCGALGQCVLLTAAQQAIANDGNNMVDYLRGQRQFEAFTAPETTPPFRLREHVLGDTVNATPVYVRRPSFGYTDAVTPTYDDYKTAQDARQGVLYVAANDGMLHALNGDTGQELWAYVPRITMPNMHRLANTNWGATHRFSVDGSPTTADVFVGGQWKTILIAGLNSGGRGYYAMDVTDPADPKVLWEICSDATLCAIVDTDIGFSYGNAEIGKRAFDGKWVAYFTSGINNVSPGNGKAYLYVVDIATGAILNKVLANTTAGTVAAPLGMNRISAFADNPFVDNKIKMIYGGDLFGNLYKFDITVNPPRPSILATLKDGTGKPQSITTRPELAVIDTFPVVYVGTGRYLGADDLVDPATLLPPLPFAYRNTLYGIKDPGTLGGMGVDKVYGNFRMAAPVVVNTLVDGGTTRTSSNNPVNWASDNGWFVDLNPGNTSPGERINLDPQLVLGTLVVVGNVPNNSVCTVGGDAFVYFFDYKSGRNVVSSAGGITGYKITGQTVVGFVIFSRGGGGGAGGGGGGGGGGTGGGIDCYYTGATGEKIRYQCPIGGGGGKARRASWRELIQQ